MAFAEKFRLISCGVMYIHNFIFNMKRISYFMAYVKEKQMVDDEALIDTVDPAVRQTVQKWLGPQYDEATRKEIMRLMKEDPKGLNDAFYTCLSFGTGGLRGVMGPGSNRMNRYTVQYATQGLANYLKKTVQKNRLRVAIGYDSRHHSKEFAEAAASVLAGNGIEVFLFDGIRPTPLVSFAVRNLGCDAGIMITASHNPPQYNGYKVYWNDGGQVLPPHDKGIVLEAGKIEDLSQVRSSEMTDPKIHLIGKEVDRAYLKAIKQYQLSPELCQKEGAALKILYSSLHGTGIAIVPQVLSEAGFSTVRFVEKQVIADGSFPTTPSPNPEERQALDMGIRQMLAEEDDIFIATDPDCDRLGVVVRHQGEARALTGNQVSAICVDAICKKMPRETFLKAGFVKTIVTTELFRAIVEHFGGHLFDVLPGFKYIAEKIRLWEEDPNGMKFIFGGEESLGYLLGTHARDKDAAIMSAVVAEIALEIKLKGKTLVDYLNDLYAAYGLYYEKPFSLKFEEGKAGKEAQAKILEKFRSSPPRALGGSPVVKMGDLKQGAIITLESGQKESVDLPRADVLLFILKDGSKVVVRPSGTEPKMKIYQLLRQPVGQEISLAQKEAELKAAAIEKEIKEFIK
jgi:phosphoglucomutase/phosphomannomutase